MTDGLASGKGRQPSVSLIEKGPRIIVYKVCCIGPIDGVPPFASDFGQRYCPQYLPLSEARRRIERQRGPLLHRDVVEIFNRRLAGQS